MVSGGCHSAAEVDVAVTLRAVEGSGGGRDRRRSRPRNQGDRGSNRTLGFPVATPARTLKLSNSRVHPPCGVNAGFGSLPEAVANRGAESTCFMSRRAGPRYPRTSATCLIQVSVLISSCCLGPVGPPRSFLHGFSPDDTATRRFDGELAFRLDGLKGHRGTSKTI